MGANPESNVDIEGLTDVQVIEQFDLAALLDRFTECGFEISPLEHREPVVADNTVVVRATDPDHIGRLDGHRWLDTVQVVPTSHAVRDWRLRAREAIDMLRVATGRAHTDLGPTTALEAAFAAR